MEEENGVDTQMSCDGLPLNKVFPDFSASLGSSESDSETSVEIQAENCVRVIPMDDEDFCSEVESQDDNNYEGYYSRKHAISSLTSRHYAAHVRVFKGIY